VNEADLERRFGGLRRLYGDADYARVRSARVAVVGLGGVGSWVVEALARSGVAQLVLFDLDHVAESNINRQAQATTHTLGMSKVGALTERVASIHPGCQIVGVEEFVAPDNWPLLLTHEVDVLVDACDQRRAKLALASWAQSSGVPFVTVGAAGGKRQPQAVEVADLGEVTHDPLLATLRQALRRQRREQGITAKAAATAPLGVRCVFSREAVQAPAQAQDQGCAVDGSLNCHGYGSSVTVTATFGMVAAAEALRAMLAKQGHTKDTLYSRALPTGR
jgi:tRNA threonylcarbamoyladenosine dehydratase